MLGYRAGEREAIERLEALFRHNGDWRGLVDILAREATRTGDPKRRQALLVEVARLEGQRLEDPTAAVMHYREALALGPLDDEALIEFAETLRSVQRWQEYVEVLAQGGLDDPQRLSPEDAIELGRVHLYSLADAARSVPYLVRAARALPERVDIAADLAEARALLGEVERAIELLAATVGRAADADARNVLRLRLARLHEEHGHDPANARLVYRDALRDGLRDPAVLDRIDHLSVGAQDWETLAEVLTCTLEEARARQADAEELRPLAIRLGHLYYKRLERPAEAAAAFVEAYALDVGDLGIYRIADGLLRKSPAAELQTRLFEARLGGPELSPKERIEVSLRLVAACEAGGRFDEAVARLEALHRWLPGDAEVLDALERLYRKAERWPDLVTMYRGRLETVFDPDVRAQLLRRLARSYEVGLRDLPAATEVYRSLLDQDPTDATTLRALSRLLEGQRRWTELLEISDRELALTDKPRQQAFIHFRMGSLYESQLANPKEATAAYRRALELDPRCFPALHGLRELAATAGHWATVIEYLRRELEMWDEPKEQAAVLARIAEIYERRLHNPAKAQVHYREAVEMWPACLPAAKALAERAFAAGRFEEAAPYYQTLTNQNLDKLPRATCSELFFRRGVVAQHLGRHLEAIESLKLALEFDSENASALQALVEAFAGKGQDEDGFAELLRRLDETYAAHRDSGRIDEMARIDVLRGYAAEQRLALPLAAEHYERAIALRPDDPGTLRPLVDLYVKQRRWLDATQVLRRFADPIETAAFDDPGARAHYIDARLWEGDLWCDMAVDPARAMECYRRVLNVSPDYREAQYRMAQCQYLMGAFDDARATVEHLLAADGLSAQERARYTYYLGRILLSGLHDEERAETHFAHAMTIDPRCAPALLAWARLMNEQGRTDELTALLETHRGLVEAPDDGDPGAALLKTLAAAVLHRHGQSDAAKRLLAPLAEREGPAARDARFALARVLEASERPEEAARQLFRTLDADPADVSALRALAELRARQGDDDRHLHALSVLELYGALSQDERALYTALRDRNRKQRDRGGKTVPDEILDTHVVHPSFRSPLLSLIGLCEPALMPRYGRPRDALRRNDQVGDKRHNFSLELRAIQTLLGFRDFELYFVADLPELVGIWPGATPAIALGARAFDEQGTVAEQRFLVGRAAFFCRARLALLHDLGVERGV
ncbi:MAG: tetratricopeptide repeat protein, partial [Myxococcales bacterium]|nr:tetratricopeptide repeat protein [Myxococcales bacterium]